MRRWLSMVEAECRTALFHKGSEQPVPEALVSTGMLSGGYGSVVLAVARNDAAALAVVVHLVDGGGSGVGRRSSIPAGVEGGGGGGGRGGGRRSSISAGVSGGGGGGVATSPAGAVAGRLVVNGFLVRPEVDASASATSDGLRHSLTDELLLGTDELLLGLGSRIRGGGGTTGDIAERGGGRHLTDGVLAFAGSRLVIVVVGVRTNDVEGVDAVLRVEVGVGVGEVGRADIFLLQPLLHECTDLGEEWRADSEIKY